MPFYTQLKKKDVIKCYLLDIKRVNVPFDSEAKEKMTEGKVIKFKKKILC